MATLVLNSSHGSGLAESVDASCIVAPANALEPSGGGGCNELLQVQHNEANDCSAFLAQDTISSEPQSVTAQASGLESFLASISSAQPNMAMNSSELYSEYTNNGFDQHTDSLVTSVVHVTADSVTVQSTGSDDQLDGQCMVLPDGQLQLTNSNQHMPTQSVAVIGQDFGEGFTLPPSLHQEPLASDQAPTVYTPQDPFDAQQIDNYSPSSKVAQRLQTLRDEPGNVNENNESLQRVEGARTRAYAFFVSRRDVMLLLSPHKM